MGKQSRRKARHEATVTEATKQAVTAVQNLLREQQAQQEQIANEEYQHALREADALLSQVEQDMQNVLTELNTSATAVSEMELGDLQFESPSAPTGPHNGLVGANDNNDSEILLRYKHIIDCQKKGMPAPLLKKGIDEFNMLRNGKILNLHCN